MIIKIKFIYKKLYLNHELLCVGEIEYFVVWSNFVVFYNLIQKYLIKKKASLDLKSVKSGEGFET